MTAVSVVKIDIDSEEFKRYKAAYDEYHAKLQSASGEWNKVNTAAAKAGKTAGEAFASQAEGMALIAVTLGNIIRKQTESETVARRSNTVWKETLNTTKGILSNVAGTTFHLLKWAAFGGIAGLATSAFGAGALSSAATGLRTTARNYGVQPGQLQAARAVFGGYFNADQALGNIAAMQSDNNQWGKLGALGISPQANPGDVLPQVLRGAVQAYRAGGQPLVDAQGYSSVLGVQDIRGLARLPAGELERSIGRYRETSGKLAQSDQDLNAWQSLNQTLKTAEDQIEKTLIKGLAPLAPDIEKLSSAIADSIADLTQNGTLKTWIGELGNGIKWLANYLGSGELRTDMRDFAQSIHRLAHPLENAEAADLTDNPVSGAGSWAGRSVADVQDWYHHLVRSTDEKVLTSDRLQQLYGTSPADRERRRQAALAAPRHLNLADLVSLNPSNALLGDLLRKGQITNEDLDPFMRVRPQGPYNNSVPSPRVQVDIHNTPGSDVTAQTNQLVPH